MQLKNFIDIDFNEETLGFREPDCLTELYGSLIVRVIEQLNDFTIEQSFYVDDDGNFFENDEKNESSFQSDALSLLRYVLKTVSLKKLLKLGFKQRHLQFIIINFSKSPFIPKVSTFITETFKQNSIQNLTNSI